MDTGFLNDIENILKLVIQQEEALQLKVDRMKYDLHEMIASQATLQLKRMQMEDALRQAQEMEEEDDDDRS